jgi:uncharacterized membrane protein AbrB (regulator of aidB expression)
LRFALGRAKVAAREEQAMSLDEHARRAAGEPSSGTSAESGPMSLRERVTLRATAKWIVIIAVLVFGGTEAETLGFPAPHLFEALVVGLALALAGLTAVQMPARLLTAAQAITGVVLVGAR